MPVTSRYSTPVTYQSTLNTDSLKHNRYTINHSRYFKTASPIRGGDDTSTATANRFVSSTNNSTYNYRSSSSIRSSIDRDILNHKPPIGKYSSLSSSSRLRSESRIRDYSLDGGYLSSSSTLNNNNNNNNTITKSDYPTSSHKRHHVPLSSGSLTHFIATSASDLRDKYSPANYIPKFELLRSKSLSEATANKLNTLDKPPPAATAESSSSSSSLSSSLTTSKSSTLNRSTSKDRSEKIRNSSSSRNALLPPTPSSSSSLSGNNSTSNRFRDRDAVGVAVGGARSTNRTLSDSDAFNRSSSSSIADRISNADNSEGLCGLRNIGNTCFMNSVLQCLSHTHELQQYLKHKSDSRSQSTKDERILYEFSNLLKEMWTPTTRSVTPNELKSAFSSKHRMYYGSAQQDAQEFLRFFLDSLHCALNKGVKGDKLEIDDNLSDNRKADLTWEWYSKIENSKIKDLFVGQLKSSLKCTVCGNSSVTFDPFWDLSVPLTNLSTLKCKLESCLDLFIKEEILDGDEMPTCSKCNTRRKSTKSLQIQRFPKYLVIHLKRFSETRWNKIASVVEFPTNERGLNMAPYAANSSSVYYSLYGVANHMGTTAEGHYVALCKHPFTKKWHEFNDNSVYDTNENMLVSSSAYLLFYERA